MWLRLLTNRRGGSCVRPWYKFENFVIFGRTVVLPYELRFQVHDNYKCDYFNDNVISDY